jgi:DNA-binding response OmpR family regulator
MRLSNKSPATNRDGPADAESDSANSATPTILVVDDEPQIVDLLTSALEDEGYQVACAYDGEQAWNLVHQQAPDLIISDVSMPRLDGLDLVRRMRRCWQLARTPVILMSAAQRTVDVQDAVFVPKPFDLDRMLSLVHSELVVA